MISLFFSVLLLKIEHRKWKENLALHYKLKRRGVCVSKKVACTVRNAKPLTALFKMIDSLNKRQLQRVFISVSWNPLTILLTATTNGETSLSRHKRGVAAVHLAAEISTNLHDTNVAMIEKLAGVVSISQRYVEQNSCLVACADFWRYPWTRSGGVCKERIECSVILYYTYLAINWKEKLVGCWGLKG